MKRVVGIVGIIVLTGLISIFNTKSVNVSNENLKVENKSLDEKIDAQEIMNTLVRYSECERLEEKEITYEDAQRLMKIAMCEAGSDGIEGKAMVMAVVLNRVDDERFPNTIDEVIHQPKQFQPVTSGAYNKAIPDLECHLALAEIEMGNYNHIEALYFENATDSWQSDNCEYLYTVGHHRFYK